MQPRRRKSNLGGLWLKEMKTTLPFLQCDLGKQRARRDLEPGFRELRVGHPWLLTVGRWARSFTRLHAAQRRSGGRWRSEVGWLTPWNLVHDSQRFHRRWLGPGRRLVEPREERERRLSLARLRRRADNEVGYEEVQSSCPPNIFVLLLLTPEMLAGFRNRNYLPRKCASRFPESWCKYALHLHVKVALHIW